ncbi:MAG: LysR family transcriptional regulator [Erysipelotrichaceae bacterium]
MEIFNYRVFLTVAKYRSFQKAAELHNVTSPAVSHIIKQLEKEFGFALFIRNNRNVSLTSEGETLVVHIKEIVRKEDELFELADELNGLDKGHVRLGIFNSMCFYIPSIIKGFNEKFPQISFEIYQGSYEDIIYWLKSGIVDIGFLSRTVNPGFSFCKIFSDPLMCIVSKDTVTESDETIKLESLDRAAFVMQRESCDADARLIMDRLNLEVRTVCHVVDDKTTVEMVKNGFGFAIMPLLTMKGMENEVKMLKIIPECEREIGVSVLNDKQLSPAVKKAFEYIRSFKYE